MYSTFGTRKRGYEYSPMIDPILRSIIPPFKSYVVKAFILATIVIKLFVISRIVAPGICALTVNHFKSASVQFWNALESSCCAAAPLIQATESKIRSSIAYFSDT